jgi:hypothetical protein
MPTIPVGITTDPIKYPCASKFIIPCLIKFLPIGYWVLGIIVIPNQHDWLSGRVWSESCEYASLETKRSCVSVYAAQRGDFGKRCSCGCRFGVVCAGKQT